MRLCSSRESEHRTSLSLRPPSTFSLSQLRWKRREHSRCERIDECVLLSHTGHVCVSGSPAAFAAVFAADSGWDGVGGCRVATVCSATLGCSWVGCCVQYCVVHTSAVRRALVSTRLC